MGEHLILFYKNKVKTSWKTAFYTTFLAVLLIHIYKFTNTLPNHDSLYNVYSNQDMTQSGRWFLQYACGISSYFDLPWINGLLCAVYLGITAAVVTDLFDLKNPVVIGLSGLILAACPSTTETLFFGFTADGYLMGLMLSAFAARLSCNAGKWWHYVISGLCLCLSCAIYQAYISFAIVLCICYLVIRLLEQNITVRNAWKWIGKHILLYVVAMAAYYVLWKVILSVTGREATDYQGISQVGQIRLTTLVGGLYKSVSNLVFLYLEWNILEHPITLYAVLNILFLVALVFILTTAVVKSRLYRHSGALFLVIFALVMSIPLISVWCFLSDGVQYHPMMLHSAVVFYIFALILFDRWISVRISTIFGFGMALVVFNFAVMANISYFYLDKCYERSYYTGSQMMNRIDEMVSGGSVEQIAFVGTRSDEVSIAATPPGNRVHILNELLEKDLLFDHHHAYLFLQNTFGLDIPNASAEQLEDLEDSVEVQEMGVWPAADSVQVIDGVMVVKLSNISE